MIVVSLPDGNKDIFLGLDLDDRAWPERSAPARCLELSSMIRTNIPSLSRSSGLSVSARSGDGSGLGVDHGPDGEKPGREFAIGVCRGGQADRAILDLGQLGDVRLGNVGGDPDGAKIGQHEQDVGGVGPLAGDGRSVLMIVPSNGATIR